MLHIHPAGSWGVIICHSIWAAATQQPVAIPLAVIAQHFCVHRGFPVIAQHFCVHKSFPVTAQHFCVHRGFPVTPQELTGADLVTCLQPCCALTQHKEASREYCLAIMYMQAQSTLSTTHGVYGIGISHCSLNGKAMSSSSLEGSTSYTHMLKTRNTAAKETTL